MNVGAEQEHDEEKAGSPEAASGADVVESVTSPVENPLISVCMLCGHLCP